MLLALTLLLGPWTAAAAPGSVRLLPEWDGGPSPARWMALEWAAGAGTALVAVPATLALGAWVGTLSSNVAWAAVPALLLLVAVPPLAVVSVEGWLGERLRPGGVRRGPAVAVALGVQVAMVVAAVLLGATVMDRTDAVLFTLAQVLVLPTVVTLTLGMTAPPPSAPPREPEPPRTLVEARASRAPGVTLFRHTF